MAEHNTARMRAGGQLTILTPRFARLGVGALSIFAVLVVWQCVGAWRIIDPNLISYPTQIASTLYQLAATGEIQRNGLVTLSEFIEGFIPAIFFGVAVGLLLALFRRLGYLIDPLFTALYTAPMIAFIPIIVVWAGVGEQSKVVVVFISAIVPIIINTHAGVREVSESWIRALRAFGATPLQVVMKAILPGAVPAIMTGIRLAVGRSIVSLIAAEMYVSIFGLGRMIQIYSTSERAAEVFVIVGVVAVFGMLSVALLQLAEGWMAPWRADR
jgi:NitT/TauT family transport system permease protein